MSTLARRIIPRALGSLLLSISFSALASGLQDQAEAQFLRKKSECEQKDHINGLKAVVMELSAESQGEKFYVCGFTRPEGADTSLSEFTEMLELSVYSLDKNQSATLVFYGDEQHSLYSVKLRNKQLEVRHVDSGKKIAPVTLQVGCDGKACSIVPSCDTKALPKKQGTSLIELKDCPYVFYSAVLGYVEKARMGLQKCKKEYLQNFNLIAPVVAACSKK